MTSLSFFSVEGLLVLISMILGAVVALLKYVEVRCDQDHSPTIRWFRRKWEDIQSSPWLAMPEKVISWAVSKRDRLGERGPTEQSWFRLLSNTLEPIALGIGSGILWGIVPGLIVLALTGAFHLALKYYVWPRWHLENVIMTQMPEEYHGLGPSPVFVLPPMFLLACGNLYIWINITLHWPVWLSFLVLTALVPTLWHGVQMVVAPLNVVAFRNKLLSYRTESWISTGVVASFSFTYLAFTVGRVMAPNSPIPQTAQMLLVNCFFDAATLISMLILMTWVLNKATGLRVLQMIAGGLVAATLFAIASLYLGLLGTDLAMTPTQTFWVLLARSTDGSRVEFGAYFWVMHTTFVPACLYLLVLLISWLGKGVASVMEKYFTHASKHSNPMQLTRALLSVVIAFLVLSATILGLVRMSAT